MYRSNLYRTCLLLFTMNYFTTILPRKYPHEGVAFIWELRGVGYFRNFNIKCFTPT